ncbi:MAG: molybdate metabolism regulator, partial [Myxococcaceae bacterium]|nr:molybdate metabolism regulator [Myxococcaceae bacterium]
KAKALKKRAAAALDEYRETHALSADALADRLVPDLDFDARGELVLDYGPRQFRVVFDETLKATLRDGDKPVKSIPRAQPTDDEAKVARAQATWAAIKTETKTLMEAQARRLERAMCARRRWSREEFTKYLHRHPLMQHLARRLVWGAFDRAGALLATFRVAEDGSFASGDDAAFELGEAHQAIGIVHPLALGPAACAAWGDLFGDYQIVQPFPQLARELYTLTPAESMGAKLTRFEGTPIAGGRFFSLKHRGWDFSEDYDLGKKLSDGSSVHLATEPGLGFLVEKPEDQTLGVVTLEHFYWQDASPRAETFGALDPIDVSEVLRDIELLKRV